MTELQEERIAECQALLAQVGLTISELYEIDENGNKIGTPKKPRK